MKAKLLRIFNHFGIETQKRKLNEECYEFLQASRNNYHYSEL